MRFVSIVFLITILILPCSCSLFAASRGDFGVIPRPPQAVVFSAFLSSPPDEKSEFTVACRFASLIDAVPYAITIHGGSFVEILSAPQELQGKLNKDSAVEFFVKGRVIESTNETALHLHVRYLYPFEKAIEQIDSDPYGLYETAFRKKIAKEHLRDLQTQRSRLWSLNRAIIVD